MRRIKAQFGPSTQSAVWRIVELEDVASQWQPELRFLVMAHSGQDKLTITKLQMAGLTNVEWITGDGMQSGDVVVPMLPRMEVAVLYRVSDKHHSLQLTNRCNSYCLMCSQPPTSHDDGWQVEEAIDAIRHINVSPRALGLSGGEPLLLGGRLREVLDTVAERHPQTRVEVLTNGRLLSDRELCRHLFEDLQTKVTWLVPLYGYADFLHDFVVQAPGAFEQTIDGLLNLQMWKQPIQLRVVLIKPVLECLPQLCTFVGRNLPFIHEVALMACEPIGFALANRDLCEVDLMDWQETLTHSARQLQRNNVPFLFMNTPLCALPTKLWSRAHRSISDWKNVYAPMCETCAAKPDCSGLFAWHERGWKPINQIKVIHEATQ